MEKRNKRSIESKTPREVYLSFSFDGSFLHYILISLFGHISLCKDVVKDAGQPDNGTQHNRLAVDVYFFLIF